MAVSDDQDGRVAARQPFFVPSKVIKMLVWARWHMVMGRADTSFVEQRCHSCAACVDVVKKDMKYIA